jgi:hypothetical protein
MIVYAHKPRRRTTASTHVTTTPTKAVVTASEPGPETVDPEAEAAVKAWFAMNIRPSGA